VEYYQSQSHVKWESKYHIIWCPKKTRPTGISWYSAYEWNWFLPELFRTLNTRQNLLNILINN